MKAIALSLLVFLQVWSCYAAGYPEGIASLQRHFGHVDGAFVAGQFIDLNTNGTERLYIKYGAISDSGVQLERMTNNVLVWRAYVQPLGVSHEAYAHSVRACIQEGKIILVSTGVNFSARQTREIREIRSLETGSLVSRTVYDVPKRRTKGSSR